MDTSSSDGNPSRPSSSPSNEERAPPPPPPSFPDEKKTVSVSTETTSHAPPPPSTTPTQALSQHSHPSPHEHAHPLPSTSYQVHRESQMQTSPPQRGVQSRQVQSSRQNLCGFLARRASQRESSTSNRQQFRDSEINSPQLSFSDLDSFSLPMSMHDHPDYQYLSMEQLRAAMSAAALGTRREMPIRRRRRRRRRPWRSGFPR